jgi:hypothetical protein
MVSSRRSILQLPRNELLTEQNSRQHAYQVGVPILAHPSSITSDASILAVHRHLVIKPGGVSSRTKDLVLHAMRLGMRDACWGSRVRACIHLHCSCASMCVSFCAFFPFFLNTDSLLPAHQGLRLCFSCGLPRVARSGTHVILGRDSQVIDSTIANHGQNKKHHVVRTRSCRLRLYPARRGGLVGLTLGLRRVCRLNDV